MGSNGHSSQGTGFPIYHLIFFGLALSKSCEQSKEPVKKRCPAPAVGTGTGLVMSEEIPGVSRFTVIFPDRPPLPLGQVGSPFFPGNVLFPSFPKSPMFSGFFHFSHSFLLLRWAESSGGYSSWLLILAMVSGEKSGNGNSPCSRHLRTVATAFWLFTASRPAS